MSYSEHLEADVKTSSIVNFNVNIFVLKHLFIRSDLKYFSLVSTSHTKQYLGFGGLLFLTPPIKIKTFGCLPTENSSTLSDILFEDKLCLVISMPPVSVTSFELKDEFSLLSKTFEWFGKRTGFIIFNRTGCHDWLCQAGVTTIILIWSFLTFLNTLPIIENDENAYRNWYPQSCCYTLRVWLPDYVLWQLVTKSGSKQVQ